MGEGGLQELKNFFKFGVRSSAKTKATITNSIERFNFSLLSFLTFHASS